MNFSQRITWQLQLGICHTYSSTYFLADSMELMPNKSIEHLNHFHQGKKTDTNPETCLAANIGNNINSTHRRLLRITFHSSRFADNIESDIIVLDLGRPAGGPITR